MFAVVLTPLLFTGATPVPVGVAGRPALVPGGDCAINPLTYVSEALRAALVPDVPHIQPWVSVLVLVATIVVSLTVGIRLFLRRAVD